MVYVVTVAGMVYIGTGRELTKYAANLAKHGSSLDAALGVPTSQIKAVNLLRGLHELMHKCSVVSNYWHVLEDEESSPVDSGSSVISKIVSHLFPHRTEQKRLYNRISEEERRHYLTTLACPQCPSL